MNTELNKLLKSAPESSEISLSIDPNDNDISERIVVGFATLDNIDQTGDIVTAEASMKAFSSFRGNIRLMHLPEPVGKVIDYRPAFYIDPDSGNQYSGIQVTARISKAADNAWIMCQDGTISGFSIGGRISRTSKQYDEKLNKTINVIDEYVLTELSLVDNPANQFANITAIRKSADNVVREGDEFSIGGDLKKVFTLKAEGGHPKVANENTNEEVVQKSNDESEVNSAESSEQDNPNSATTEIEVTHVNSAEKNDNPAVEEVEVEEVEQQEEVDPVKEEPQDEVETLEVDIKAELETALEGFKTLLQNASEKLATEFSEKMQKLNEDFDAKVASVTAKQEELAENFSTEKALADKLDDMKKTFDGRLDEISKSAAFKKSADNEPVVDDNSGTWKGAFTGDYRQA